MKVLGRNPGKRFAKSELERSSVDMYERFENDLSMFS